MKEYERDLEGSLVALCEQEVELSLLINHLEGQYSDCIVEDMCFMLMVARLAE
jgi:hypothetical protein